VAADYWCYQLRTPVSIACPLANSCFNLVERPNSHRRCLLSSQKTSISHVQAPPNQHLTPIFSLRLHHIRLALLHHLINHPLRNLNPLQPSRHAHIYSILQYRLSNLHIRQAIIKPHPLSGPLLSALCIPIFSNCAVCGPRRRH
jgi:hypothetical protein